VVYHKLATYKSIYIKESTSTTTVASLKQVVVL
jgi:hypothetical protein